MMKNVMKFPETAAAAAVAVAVAGAVAVSVAVAAASLHYFNYLFTQHKQTCTGGTCLVSLLLPLPHVAYAAHKKKKNNARSEFRE